MELLYPTVVVKQADNRGRPGRGRGAHEVQQQSDAWYGDWPMPDASDQQFGEWLEYHDPVETVAEAFSYEEEQAIQKVLHVNFMDALPVTERTGRSLRKLSKPADTMSRARARAKVEKTDQKVQPRKAKAVGKVGVKPVE